MLHTLELLLRVAFFRAGPREIPYSVKWLSLFTLAAFILKVAAYPPPYDLPIVLEVLDIACIAGLLLLVLHWLHKRERWVQTFTTIMGVLTLQTLAFDGLTLLLPKAWLVELVVFFTVWELAMLSHVLSYTLEVRVRYAVLYVVVFEICRLSLMMGVIQAL